jgi:hypothetical protein
MPKAALVQNLIVDGEVVISEGEILTGLQAHKLWLQYRQRMKFRCLCCQLPLTPVSVHRDKWKRRPHFRPNKDKKEDHYFPCAYAGGNEHGSTSTGEFEIAYDELEIPTKLVQKMRRPSRSTVTISNPDGLAPEDDRTPETKYERHTCHAVEELCDVYFEKIKDKTANEYRMALQEFR